MAHVESSFGFGQGVDWIASLENFPADIYIKNRASEFVYANQACCTHLGVACEQVISATDRDFFARECADAWLAQEQQIVQEGISMVDVQVQEKWLDAAFTWCRTTKLPLFGTSGEVIGLFGVNIDVTSEHRKLIRLQHAVDGARDGVWYRNLDSQEVWFSDRWKQMLGYEPREIGNDIRELWNRVHPNDLKRVKTAADEHLRGKTPEYHAEFRMQKKDGVYAWILARGKVTEDTLGRRFAGSHTDITDSKETDSFLRVLVNTMDNLVFVKDDQLQFTYVNEAAARSYGRNTVELIGLTDREVNPNQDQVKHFENNDLEVLKNKRPIAISEEELTFPDGATHVLATKKAPIIDEATGNVQVLAVATDITQLKDKSRIAEAVFTVLLDAIREIEESRNEEEACDLALVCLDGLGYQQCMMSFLEHRGGERVVVANLRYAKSARWQTIAKNTVRPYDIAAHERDVLPTVLDERKARFILDSREYVQCDQQLSREVGLISQYIAPLATEQMRIGTLQVDMGSRTVEPADDCRMIDALAAHLSLAIDRHRTVSRLDSLNNQLTSHGKFIAFEFAAARVVHELNHSITDFLGQVHTAQANPEVRKNKAAMDFLARTSRFADKWRSALKENLQAFNRDEERKSQRVDEIITDTIDSWIHKAAVRKCKLRGDVDCAGVCVYVSRGALQEVLACLIINAIDAHAKNILVSARTTQMRSSIYMASYVEIIVEDDGDGIPSEFQDEISKVGWTSKGGEGHGLGLALVDLIVKDFGGRFALRSSGKSGGEDATRFSVLWPITD